MEPVRTCVGCRQRDLFKNLLRVIKDLNTFQVSDSSKGRGAWIHPSCMSLGIERKGFQRALGEATVVNLEAWQRNQAEKNADNQMSTSK